MVKSIQTIGLLLAVLLSVAAMAVSVHTAVRSGMRPSHVECRTLTVHDAKTGNEVVISNGEILLMQYGGDGEEQYFRLTTQPTR